MRDAIQRGVFNGQYATDNREAVAKRNSTPLLREGPVFASVVIGAAVERRKACTKNMIH